MLGKFRNYYLLILIFLCLAGIVYAAFSGHLVGPTEYISRGLVREEKPPLVEHLDTPKIVRGIYMTSWVAGTTKWREDLINFAKKTGRH